MSSGRAPIRSMRAAGDARRTGIAAGLDPVGHHFIFAAVQSLDPVDDEVRRADALDLRAHRHQQVAEVDDLRLARGIEQLGPALGEHRRHHSILGRANRNDGEAEIAARQAALRRARPHIAGRQLDFGAHALRALSGEGRSAGRRSRSRRAATPSPHPSAQASARARAPTRASSGPCRKARRSKRCRRPAASSGGRSAPSSRRRRVETPSWLSRWPNVSTSARRGRLASVSFSSVSSAHGSNVSAASSRR